MHWKLLSLSPSWQCCQSQIVRQCTRYFCFCLQETAQCDDNSLSLNRLSIWKRARACVNAAEWSEQSVLSLRCSWRKRLSLKTFCRSLHQMNEIPGMHTLATCLLVAAVSYWFSSELLTALRLFISDSALGRDMPEPEGNRRSPQGVPYTDLPHIVNADGLHLFCRYWEPDSPPK